MLTVTVKFAGKDTPIKELVARCLAANYQNFGFVDDDNNSAAILVAERLLSVLDDLGCEIIQKQR